MSVFERHRGPYCLMVTRPFVTKPGFTRGEWLKGAPLPPEDAYSEALSLLGDPRDTIAAVHVWSVGEQQFVMTYRPQDLEAAKAAA